MPLRAWQENAGIELAYHCEYCRVMQAVKGRRCCVSGDLQIPYYTVRRLLGYHSNVSCGLTLIELLIVITIVGIIAAFLFPVFERVKEKSRATVCLSNLRQIGMAFHLYACDYDGFHPSPMYKWSECLRPYVREKSVLTCTSYMKGKRGIYAYNGSLHGRTPVHESEIEDPAGTIIVHDTLSSSFSVATQFTPITEYTLMRSGVYPNHLGAVNVLFADGHVGGFPLGRLTKRSLWTKEAD